MRVCDLVQRTLDVLRVEAHTHHALLVAELAAISLTVEIGAERIEPAVVNDTIVLCERPAFGAVRVRLALHVILDLVEGRDSLLTALRSRRLVVVGDRVEVARLERALSIYVHGLARCTSASGLLVALQAMTGGGSYGN